MWHTRQSLWMMIERDFKARYIGSVAGMLWSIIHPLMMVIIYSLVFSLIFGRKIGDTPFSLWLFCALLPWIMFSEIVKNSTGIIEKNANLITKTPFHSEVLPLVVIGSALTGHIIGFAVLIFLLLICKQSIGLGILLIPFYTGCLILFSLGLSWLVSALNVFIKDIAQIFNVILQLWFYLCPIIYPASIIPKKYLFLLKLNPMYFITEGYRRSILENKGILAVDCLLFFCITIFMLFLGGWVFRRLKVQFAEVL